MAAVDPHHRRAFERIYEHRRREGRWPKLDKLQRQLTSEDEDVDLRAVATHNSPYVWITSPSDDEGERIRLSLRGLACVPAARPLLEAYLQVIQRIIGRYRDSKAEPIFTADDLREMGFDLDTENELSDLLTTDSWAFGGGHRSPDGGSWSYEISDHMVRLARGAETVDELMRRRFGEPANQEDDQPAHPRAEPLIAKPGASPVIDADRPISTPGEDLLDRVPLVRVLAAQAAGQLGDGFVMGVSGPWGSGKTSLLNLMTTAIEQDETGYVVRFDPWLFSSSEELVLRFLGEVSAQLEHRGRLGDAAASIGEYAQILAPLTAVVGVPWLLPPITIWQRLTGRRSQRKAEASAHERREKASEVLRKLDRRLVVLIDDLDRLQPDEIRDVMRLVKLVGDFPNTTYVLAYDQARVACALGDGEQGGREFLEKIVQLTHEVPQVDHTSLSRVLGDSISKAVGDVSRYSFDQQAYTNLFAHARALFLSVRDVRRYTNVLPGTLALVGKEVELADVLALEALRVRVPSSFALIVAGKQALTQPSDAGYGTPADDERAQQQVQAIVQAAGQFRDEVEAIIRRLFPAAQRHLGGSHYSAEWLGSWRRDRRVAHHQVLDIYLNRALPPGVLPAALVESAFESLQDGDALSSLLDGLDDDGLESLLDRLEHYEKDFPVDRVETPIAVLYNHQQRLQRPKRHVLDLGAEYKVGRIVLRLLRNLDRDEAARATNAALGRIRAIGDRVDLVELVGYREDSGHELVSEEDATALEQSLFDDVLTADTQALNNERDLLRLLLWVHGAQPSETSARVEGLIEDDSFLLSLLRAALTETVGQTTGEAAVRRSHRLSWDALTELVRPERLAERVKQLAARTAVDDLDERTRTALEQATRSADDPGPA